MIIDQETKEIMMEREVYTKEWEINKARIAEGVILLDMIYMINSKSYNVEGANMLIVIDNQAV